MRSDPSFSSFLIPLQPLPTEQGKVRVLSTTIVRQTEELEAESRAFAQKIQEFAEAVHGVVDGLNTQSAVIEREKMKAIGIRNIVEGEKETRRRKQRELQALVDEKAAELARMNSELASLQRIQDEQEDLISRLANNEGTGIQ